jgi:parvulin-like peptidyl-prolyl isomerase
MSSGSEGSEGTEGAVVVVVVVVVVGWAAPAVVGRGPHRAATNAAQPAGTRAVACRDFINALNLATGT